MKLTSMNLVNNTISTTKAGKRFLTLQFSNGKIGATVQYFDIDNPTKRAEMLAKIGDHVRFEGDKVIVDTNWVDAVVYSHNGRNGVYFSFDEGYTYNKYDFVPYGIDKANSIMLVDVTLSVDDEQSFIVDWHSSTGEHRGARFINTRIKNGELQFDAERLMDNIATLADAFDLDADETVSTLLSGIAFAPVTKKVSVRINKGYRGDKTYLTFSKVVEGD